MINGLTLRDAYISAANSISNARQPVDELNVFPVPDGDTGTNMSMTMNSAARALSQAENLSCGEISELAASALLRGARGNSGVILSLLFRGFARGLKDVTEADGIKIAESLALGVESAYKAVMKPTEGTILTVARVASEKAKIEAQRTDNPVTVLEAALAGAEEALLQTPELLPVLKQAGVVDAGGKGFVVILTGMLSVIRDGQIAQAASAANQTGEAKSLSAAAEYEGEITFTYCTEFIVNRDKSVMLEPLKLRAYIESIGDSAVVVDDEQIIKVHVHTNDPGQAIQEALKFGPLVNIKIDNMREQHEKSRHDAKREKPVETSAGEYTPVKPEKPFGFVSVAAGDGLATLFVDLGVDSLVKGGQTMNPSTEDILRAIELTPAETVFVLPNNKNIIMAAEQAAPLATRKVIVINTRTVPMGISAMLAFDPDLEAEENAISMSKAASKVSTGQITFAARDSDFDGRRIKEGEILALENGRLAFVEQNVNKAILKLGKALCKKDSQFVTLIYGEDVSEADAVAAKAALESRLGLAEVTLINGGQPVYYYILSVE